MGLFFSCAATRISATRLLQSRRLQADPNPSQASVTDCGRLHETGEVAAAWRLEIGRGGVDWFPAPLIVPLTWRCPVPCAVSNSLRLNLPPHRPEAATGLRSALAPTSYRSPQMESSIDSLSMITLVNVLDVKENVRVTPITPYDERCVILVFHTIVDAPWPSCCNRV